ncbi:UNVERIFIED_CONTAM: hypothetical protein Sradi_4443500 [Sesamum radiatum]|uniref:NB-ARC domain-containing protein n=1 Tax=Sesamum radiatum TaxID=300843 RepID=A0AAW2NT17_SESRA
MLRDVLFTRKFLPVPDDYWSESPADWDVLCLLFRFGSKGSKIIVTTRSAKILLIVSCSKAYKLEILSDDDCWKLIEQRTLVCNANESEFGTDQQTNNKEMQRLPSSCGDTWMCFAL